MNLFEKMGLVERDVPNVSGLYAPPAELPVEEPDVGAEIKSPANIVSEIYDQNGLSDRSDSIFTVQALIETLPPEMTTAKKQATVYGILQVSGKSVDSLLEDATKRIERLAAARDKVVEARTDEISDANADIESLKQAIESATIRIKEAEEIINATKQSVSDEVSAIDGLVEFCKGMEAGK